VQPVSDANVHVLLDLQVTAGGAVAVLGGGVLQEADEDLEAARRLLCLQVKPCAMQSVPSVHDAYVYVLCVWA
jgi:hypothetical protein